MFYGVTEVTMGWRRNCSKLWTVFDGMSNSLTIFTDYWTDSISVLQRCLRCCSCCIPSSPSVIPLIIIVVICLSIIIVWLCRLEVRRGLRTPHNKVLIRFTSKAHRTFALALLGRMFSISATITSHPVVIRTSIMIPSSLALGISKLIWLKICCRTRT